MKQQVALWLCILAALSTLELLAVLRSFAYSWSRLVIFASSLGAAVIGLTTGSGTLCLAVGALLQVVFVLVPAIILSSINAKLFILDVESARQLLPRLRFVSWGKPYDFVVARVNAFADYIQDRRHEGDRLMLEWQKPGLPRPVVEQAQATVFNGRLLLWDWPGAIELFEQMRTQPNLPKPFWLWVSRAYSELGYLNRAVNCIVEADLAEFAGTQQMLAAALLPFFALAGSLKHVNDLNLTLSRGAGSLPEFARCYWLARCLSVRGDNAPAADTYKRALALFDAGKSPSPLWRRRIESQLDKALSVLVEETHMEKEGSALPAANAPRPQSSLSVAPSHEDSNSHLLVPDHALTKKADRVGEESSPVAAIDRIWSTYQHAVFVQEIVSPKKRSKTIAALVVFIVSTFVFFRLLTVSGNNDWIGFEMSCWAACVLDPRKVLDGQYWRLVSYMFLHKDEVHVVVNVIGLLWFGRIAQNIFGTARFLGIFFLAGIMGGILHCIGQPDVLSVGVSGAVMGVFGAAGVGIFRLRGYIPPRIRRTELAWLATLALSGILIDQFIPRVASVVHLGGLLSGALFGTIVNLPRPQFEASESKEDDDIRSAAL